jgi:predicted AlkP superfamily phosphohydrolase/phosphomutase
MMSVAMVILVFWPWRDLGWSSWEDQQLASSQVRLYWLVLDGLRADPHVFPIYQWAEEGILPNIKKMMESGSYGYSIPTFPSHTPVNFATLFTGASPAVHGITDEAIRIEGHPLDQISKGGFSSFAKKVPPIWYTLEERGYLVSLISVPGSTPPELRRGITVKGRWGGWGWDLPAVVLHSAADEELQKMQRDERDVLSFGEGLTRFFMPSSPQGWQMDLPASFSPPREAAFRHMGQKFYAYFYDATDDQKSYYDRVLFSWDKKIPLIRLKEGEWSPWLPVRLSWPPLEEASPGTENRVSTQKDSFNLSVDTAIKIKAVKLGEKDFFRFRMLFDGLNEHLVEPSFWAERIERAVGPMVDYVDHYPPQLIYYPEDKATFLEEAQLSMDWHKNIVSVAIHEMGSQIVIHSLYTPNQMLASRWWMGALDPATPRYNEFTEEERSNLLHEVQTMYKGIDRIVGEILKHTDEEAYIVLSADHGVLPLYQEVRLNNMFAQRGWLSYETDAQTGQKMINWKETKVIFLKTNNVYINPQGLNGVYHRTSGVQYEQLREEVVKALSALKNAQGISPIAEIVKHENARRLGLPQERVGDLVVVNNTGYHCVENISADRTIFYHPVKSGYKQAVWAEKEKGLWTPFMVKGPGIKKHYPISHPIHHQDQYPTLLKLLHQKPPDFIEGKVIEEMMDNSLPGVR